MKSLSDIADKGLTNKTYKRLEMLFTEAGDNIEDYNVVKSDNGEVTVDGHTFSFIYGALRMKGFCSNCGMDAWSSSIHVIGDIGSMLRHFKVGGPHTCAE